VRPLLAVAAALSLAFAPAGAEAKKPAKRAKVVCFEKRGKRVCRPKRKAVPRPGVATPKSAPAVAAPAPAAPVLSAAAPASTTTTETTTTTTTVTTVVKPDCGTSPWVAYTAEDVDGVFRFNGKRTCAPGPEVLFQVNNRDAQDHNLYAEGVSPAAARRAIFAKVEPGEVAEGSATLAAGEWRLLCTIEGHESMTRTLTVTG